MAYLLNEEEEKQQQQSAQSQPPSGQLGLNQGQSVQQLIKKPQASGQFTNIQQFLQANQRTGQNVAEKIKSDTTKSTQNLTTTGLQNILQTKSQLEQEQEQDKSAAQKLQSSAEQARQAVRQNDPLLKPQSQAFNPFANLAKEDEDQMYKITSGDASNIQRGSQQFQTQVAQNLSDFGQQQQLLSQSLADPNLRSQLMTRSLKGGVGYTRGQEALDRSITDAIGGAILKQGMYSGLGTIGQASDEQVQIGQDFSERAQDYLNWLAQTSKQSRDILSVLSKDVQDVTQKRKGEVERDLGSLEQFFDDLQQGKYSLSDLYNLATQDSQYYPYGVDTRFVKLTKRVEPPTELSVPLDLNAPLPEGQEFTTSKERMARHYEATVVPKMEAVVNEWFRQNFGISLDDSIYGTNLRNAGMIDRTGLLEKLRTSEEVATLNAINRLLQGSQAEQLSAQQGLGLLGSDLVKFLDQQLRQSIEAEKEKAIHSLRGQMIRNEGSSFRHTAGIGTSRAYRTAEADAYDVFTNPNNFNAWVNTAFDREDRAEKFGIKGDAANWGEASDAAIQGLRLYAQQRLQPLLRERNFFRTLRSLLRGNKQG